MEPQPTARDVEAVEQRRERRAEEPVAEEIGRQIHQDGGVDVAEPHFEKEVNCIVDSKEQYGTTHDAPRTEIVGKDGLVGGWGQQEIDAEEDHQRQGDAERVFVKRVVHTHFMLVCNCNKDKQ